MKVSKVDLVLKNGKIFTSYGLLDAGLVVDDGKIVAVAKDAHLPGADRVIDVKGNLIIPGGIDAHVHIYNGEKFRYREDFESGTKAALAGGTTMVIDFAGWGEDVEKSFERVKMVGERESLIDFSLHVYILDEKSMDCIHSLAEKGVASFKHVLANCNGLEQVMNDGILLESFRKVGKAKGIVSVHAESEEIRRHLQEELKKAGRIDATAHAESRPRICEDEAAMRAILFAEEAGVPLHIFHVGSGNVADFLRRCKQEGFPLTGETCPHFLFFTQEDLRKFGPYLQTNPCLKSREDRDSLWRAVADGSLDIITTDHYAPLKREKDKGWENIWEVEGGVPGVETRLMLMMSEGVNKGRISLERFVDACCTKPARIFGFYPRKGVIQPRSDADIVVIDRKKEFKISADRLHHKADWTPFEGWRMKGIPVMTVSKGELMMVDGEVWGKLGKGRFVPCQRHHILKK
ncbi:dihydroorotase [Candidatus Hecatella orcuttiae]|jgi:D-hydantoinase|uniref:dihydroorotase n=1 Tax=Candidatus Hecatella orcuttiae TaxID=1935119 RepID=UPI002867BB9D|nr:amidohydrolase family protein [Candidatus Hecatella orcuttiae]